MAYRWHDKFAAAHRMISMDWNNLGHLCDTFERADVTKAGGVDIKEFVDAFRKVYPPWRTAVDNNVAINVLNKLFTKASWHPVISSSRAQFQSLRDAFASCVFDMRIPTRPFPLPQVDTNDDGRLSWDEFSAYVLQESMHLTSKGLNSMLGSVFAERLPEDEYTDPSAYHRDMITGTASGATFVPCTS